MTSSSIFIPLGFFIFCPSYAVGETIYNPNKKLYNIDEFSYHKYPHLTVSVVPRQLFIPCQILEITGRTVRKMWFA